MSTLCPTRMHIIETRFVTPAFHAVTLIISIAFIYLYIAAYCKNELKTSKMMFYFGIAFLFCITLMCISLIIRQETYCQYHVVSGWFRILAPAFYFIQVGLLMTTLFLRLAFIFKDTQFKLAKRTIYVYAMLCIVLLALTVFLIAFMLTGQSPGMVSVLAALAALDYLCQLFWINYLFVAKLMRVYKQCKDSVSNEDKLLHIATKNAILCVVSSSTIFLQFTITIIYFQAPSPFTAIVVAFAIQFDLVTNMLSILLAYRRFDAWYLRLCGCCHRACSAFCLGNNNKDEEMVRKEVQSASAGEAQTTHSEL
mmetsp:Transcript_44644/g.71451  ORF Transcript_44644/g.71451 Transcript_44644/m.71451 type:complete len:310 (+) Transcript_44644:33-962(+)